MKALTGLQIGLVAHDGQALHLLDLATGVRDGPVPGDQLGGDIAAQLVARHWLITDARGQTQEVRGLAVVGHQPLLQPGERFQYSSWAQIATPQGSMSGRFLCVTEQAEVFYAPVPEFALAEPGLLH